MFPRRNVPARVTPESFEFAERSRRVGRPGKLTALRTNRPGIGTGVYPRHLLPRKDRGRMSPEEAATPMRHYQLMIILDPNLEERTVQPSLDQFLKVVTGGGGKVEKVDIWGKRRLSYQIEKKAEGFYAVVDLTAEPATVQELDRQLNLNEAILRTKVTRPEHHH
jgi:small subunit ribosomal protein S6